MLTNSENSIQASCEKFQSLNYKSTRNIENGFVVTGPFDLLYNNRMISVGLFTSSLIKKVTYNDSEDSFYVYTQNSIYRLTFDKQYTQHVLYKELFELTLTNS